LYGTPKLSIKPLGPNKTEKGIERIGKAIGTVGSVVSHFDE
jgi:hypothetical protein